MEGVGVSHVDIPWSDVAAQMVEGPPIRNVRGSGLGDPALVQLSINDNLVRHSPGWRLLWPTNISRAQ